MMFWGRVWNYNIVLGSILELKLCFGIDFEAKLLFWGRFCSENNVLGLILALKCCFRHGLGRI